MTELERLLAESLKAAGESYRPSDAPLAKQRFLQRRRRRWLLWTGGVLGATVGATALALLVLEMPRPAERRAAPASDPRLVVAAEIEVGEHPTGVATGFGSVWVANADGRSITRVDAATDEVEATIPVEAGNPDEVVAGAGAVWVSNLRGSVMRIDPQSNDVVAEIDMPGEEVEGNKLDLAVAGGSVWAADMVSGEAHQIDPRANEAVVGTWDPEVRASDIAAGDGATWILDGERGRLRWVHLADPPTPSPTAAAATPATGTAPGLEVSPTRDDERDFLEVAPAGANADLAVGFGWLWVAAGDPVSVLRVDPESGRYDEIEVGGDAGPDDYADLAIGKDAVWALSADADGSNEGTLSAIDPDTLEVVAELRLDGLPLDVAAGEGAVWVAHNASDRLTRIELRPGD